MQLLRFFVALAWCGRYTQAWTVLPLGKDVTALAEHAVPLGILGVVALQFITFVLYCIADPDPRHRSLT